MNCAIYIDRSSPLPLYAQLQTALQQAIRRGELAYGEKLPSENEFMELLGLSRMTIRSALSQLSQDNYIHKIHGKGTFVCYKAESAAAGKVDVLLDVTYAYFSTHYIKSISEVLSAFNYQFVIHDTQDSQDHICDILEKILQSDSAGILLQPSHLVEPTLPRLKNLLLAINERGIPIVMLDRSIDGVGSESILFDDYMGGRIAAEYLVALGHKKCAMICCSSFAENKPRFTGFNDLLLERDLTPLFAIEKDQDMEQNLIRLVKDQGITAIFNYNDEVALKTFRYLASAGIRIPQDVSVLGYDDTVLTKATDPQMTSVIHPKELLGHIASRKLLSLIEGDTYVPPREQLFPTLNIRGSCSRARATEKKEV